ncbi:unnamed protein product [Vitrella brassicaformis CCMP3155]|uniref:Uncharacterized protein n=1 Tax=Vitrella brassicaformis (strain CCMP3155) TaxID=1169540 RepID=A0A0G4FFK8_VITBC|nr:unnamed protein product [Vitrella brassicaformis CCMP3155]|mmetsp:Transcript_20787/g.50701  ORF Transcript_20787/g.50701 Transcript_20787/m.50701 type:complete len:295 (-) Transcript_20787:258-1142(-)|eukprot:CEM11653.1 unnamed protein product [Vitrella brassicaformis CCMP3155]
MFDLVIDVLIVVVCLVILGGAAGYMLWSEWKSQKSSTGFFQEAELRLGYPVPRNEIRYYDKIRTDAMRKFQRENPEYTEVPINEFGEEDETLSDTDEPDEFTTSWLRQLSPEEKRLMRTGLMKRAIANLPRYQEIQKDYPGKEALYRRRLISEHHWQLIRAAYKDLVDEINFIQKEAECLEDGWGQRIFPQAYQLWRANLLREAQQKEVEKRQKQKEKEAEKLKKQKEHEEKIKQQKLEKEQRLAEKKAAALIKAEEEAKCQASSKSSSAKAAPKSGGGGNHSSKTKPNGKKES